MWCFTSHFCSLCSPSKLERLTDCGCVFSPTCHQQFCLFLTACVNLSLPQFHFVYCALFGLRKWFATACQGLIWYCMLKGCSFIIFYEEALPGCVWCVCICNASTRSPAGVGVGGIFTFAAILCQHLHPDTDVCVALDRACPPITFSMTTELHSGSNLHLSVMRTKSSSHLEIPALTTGWHKHLTSELCRRTKTCRLTSWHKRHVGTISIMAQISKAILSPKLAVCYA